MTRIYEQPPSGGCDNCGRPVRSRKDGAWVCHECHKRGA